MSVRGQGPSEYKMYCLSKTITAVLVKVKAYNWLHRELAVGSHVRMALCSCCSEDPVAVSGIILSRGKQF